MTPDTPDGFILSDAAMYSFVCQDVYPDIVSFAAAIPDHLKPLFLIPIKLEKVTTASQISRRVARRRYADGIVPSGDTPEADLFGVKTFVNYDREPDVPNSGPGSIFRRDDAEGQTHHQEWHEDQNVQVPTETSYNTDVDMTETFEGYPYRLDALPVRHSSFQIARPVVVRLALKPEVLEPHAPKKIQENARSCSVSLVSYDKRTRVFTFSVDCGNVPRTVQASLSDIDEVAMICNCPFWQWNGPEYNAQANSYLLGQPYGTASPPDIRDPNREYWMCKHAYAVLRKLDSFVQEIVTENWDESDEELLARVDEEWDRLEGVAEVPIDEQVDEEIEANWEEEEPEDEKARAPEPEEEPAESVPPPEEEHDAAEDYSGEEEPGESDEGGSEDSGGYDAEEPEDYDEAEAEAEAEEPVDHGEESVESSDEEGLEDYDVPEEPSEDSVDYSGGEDEEDDDGKK